ncbi:type II toxin-antitoxin system VapC family toxin [Gryllotalpicola koreensis]|uniref:Type II toxin-antitoxin system VapC family toxin n=1 Tax=Gryllotalpicola koreensis TaxID=993086 RepID=A0ABP7ZPT7_9MICO
MATEATLVDTNVLIDVLTDDRDWADWSEAALAAAIERGPLVINPIIYAEVSVRYDAAEELDAVLPPDLFRREPLPYAAGFLAGKAFARYRSRRGPRRSPLPDFYIGAHAAVAGHTLLTRDAARYRTYFPRLTVIAP